MPISFSSNFPQYVNPINPAMYQARLQQQQAQAQQQHQKSLQEAIQTAHYNKIMAAKEQSGNPMSRALIALANHYNLLGGNSNNHSPQNSPNSNGQGMANRMESDVAVPFKNFYNFIAHSNQNNQPQGGQTQPNAMQQPQVLANQQIQPQQPTQPTQQPTQQPNAAKTFTPSGDGWEQIHAHGKVFWINRAKDSALDSMGNPIND